MNISEKIDCEACGLKSKCLYRLLTPKQKELLNTKKIILKKKKGDILYYQGDYASAFFMVRKGLLKHTRQIDIDYQVFGDFKKEGELTGLASIKLKAVFPTSVSCFTDVWLCAFPNYVIIPFIQSNYQVAEFFFDLLERNLELAAKKIIELTGCSAFSRVGRMLLFLHERLPNNKNGFEIKREELADLAGITRETLSRQLGLMKRGKLISTIGRYIKILQPALLKERSKCK